ncbi:hypothetical protein OESDEN_23830 [Oesophagostomum dentatum]|uniref:glucuronosyltransferase n=1 Tax=Oesophagostomum dentatum TaxID=61180 RepID=A0A0B1S007_OESDE|nr:hypothetical protein OESDEN_23830 [Oesophagostomum dentatum]
MTYQIGYEYLSFCVGDETFQRVMNTAYDLVIADELFPSSQAAMALKLRERFGTKFASLATTDISSIFYSYRSISRNPVVTPNHYTKGYEMHNFKVENFLGRLRTIWDTIEEQYFINIISNDWMAKAGKLLGIKSSLKEFFEASHLTFMDFPSRYGFPASSTSSFIHVGEHCEEGKQLPRDLQEFVEDPRSRGTIYIAFGSIVNWAVAPAEVVATFFAALNSLVNYRVIFSYGGPVVKGLKPHVKIVQWAPQNDILSHNKTILFFTHGGLKSVKEGICTETAMLFLPIFRGSTSECTVCSEVGHS